MKEGWKYESFGNVFPIRMGKTPPRADKEMWDANKNTKNLWVSVADITSNEGQDIISTKEHISELAAQRMRIVPKGYLLMSFKLTIGKMAFAGKDLFTNEAIIAIPKNDKYNLRFLYYYLSSYNWDTLTTGTEKVKGKTLNKSSIGKIQLPIISLPEQERIVSLLDAEFAKIDAIKANAEKQYDDTMALYKSALKDLLTPADDWKDSIINDIIDHGSNISYGIVQPGDNLTEGVPVVRPVDLILNETLTSTKYFKKTSESISQAYSRTILNGKEILMCVRGTTGVVSLSSKILKGCNVTRGIVPFKINDDLLRKFIFYTFQAPKAFDFIQQYTQGAALKQINIKDVKNIPISLPSDKSDIESIVNRLDAISHLCYKLKSNYFTTVTLCNDLKQSILKDIFG